MSYDTKYYLEITRPIEFKDRDAELNKYLKFLGYYSCLRSWDTNNFYDEAKEVGGLSLLFPNHTFKVTSIGEDYYTHHSCGYINVSQIYYKNGKMFEAGFKFDDFDESSMEQNIEADKSSIEEAFNEAAKEDFKKKESKSLKDRALAKLSPEERASLDLK